MSVRNLIKRQTLYFWASVVVPAVASAASDTATPTVGQYVFTLPPPLRQCVFRGSGYQNSLFGSYSPTTL